jgi:hypothetical protein
MYDMSRRRKARLYHLWPRVYALGFIGPCGPVFLRGVLLLYPPVNGTLLEVMRKLEPGRRSLPGGCLCLLLFFAQVCECFLSGIPRLFFLEVVVTSSSIAVWRHLLFHQVHRCPASVQVSREGGGVSPCRAYFH